MEQNGKKIAVIVVVVVLVALVAWWLIATLGGGKPGAGGGEGAPLGEDTLRPENAEALATVEGGTREVVQEAIATPEVGATDVPSGVAVPQNVVETGPSSFRQFNIEGNGGDFVPSTIVVNEGDVIDINFTAVDDEYNVYFPDFGISKTFARGQSGKIQFQGYPFGEYRFYCKDVCSGTVEGKLIVNKRS